MTNVVRPCRPQKDTIVTMDSSAIPATSLSSPGTTTTETETANIARRPPPDAYDDKYAERSVTLAEFQANWDGLPAFERWGKFSMAEAGVDCIWSFDRNCWIMFNG